MQPALQFGADPWFEVRDGDPRLRPIYNRHYSSRGSQNPQIVGPGSHAALLTHDLGALFVWRWFMDSCPLAPPLGINCAVFRREHSDLTASELILAAEPFAVRKWGAGRPFYTYVNSSAVESSNPGYCFQRAGWQKVGVTAGGHGRPRLVVLVKHAESGLSCARRTR